MTDLSKELGEIKRRLVEDEQRQWIVAEPLMFLVEAMRDRAKLLRIIEVEIPGMLRARCASLSALINPAVPENMHILQYAIDELNAYSTLIESLTKDNEKENG